MMRLTKTPLLFPALRDMGSVQLVSKIGIIINKIPSFLPSFLPWSVDSEYRKNYNTEHIPALTFLSGGVFCFKHYSFCEVGGLSA